MKWIKWFLLFSKLLLLIAIIIIAFGYLSGNPKFEQSFFELFQNTLFNFQNLPTIFLLIIMSVLNWSLEALKWQLLIKYLHSINFREAMQGVLSGVSFSFIGLSHVGHFAGRIWHLPAEIRTRAAGVFLTANYPQALCSYTFGYLALVFWLYEFQGFPLWGVFLGFIFIFVGFLVGLAIYFKLKEISVFFLKAIHLLPSTIKQSASRFFQELSFGSKHVKLLVLGYSLARYFTFVFQFCYILYLFNIESPFSHVLEGVMLIYWVKSSLPSVSFLSDLGIREISAYLFFKDMGAPEEAILGATLFTWSINVLLPACLGALLIKISANQPHFEKST
ncbi:MAG: lysylphosphatidylglycerol synthase domain-containing protein [Cytophagales bacterium]|nr:lysylphosphatidylglycerol synthase domain-containing protein [Cytophagales bacterium]MDW8384770.1 lysylphosphatidylglycerol synthase domain-containing protein [Flammeovirgaceae bacterium]